MDIKNNGGPAFPAEYFLPEVFAERRQIDGVHEAKRAATGVSQGMTLRDYFAAQALAGFAHRAFGLDSAEHYSHLAYQWADAMLKARAA